MLNFHTFIITCFKLRENQNVKCGVIQKNSIITCFKLRENQNALQNVI